jgi:phosphatidylserine decarboxylase
MFAADGYKIIIVGIVVFILLVVITCFFPYLVLKILTTLVGIGCVFNLYFLRDPEREIPTGENLILSPADGTVLKIEKIYEPRYFQDTVTCISIFMSVMNVHVNRIPVSGTVDFLNYIKGQFRVAYIDKASEDNEQSIIGIRNAGRRVLLKQIAGIVARRIVFHLQKGQPVRAGDRFGLIRYGSRLDVFFENTVQVKVKPADKVYGGVTVLGEFTDL